MKRQYTDKHAIAGINTVMPELETFPNQYKNYIITIDIPEYSSICPKSGLPDCGKLVIRYIPDKKCIELKSLKLYLQQYRNEGIFYEDVTNKILHDLVAACSPRYMKLLTQWNPRGGMTTNIKAEYKKKARRRK